MLVRKYCIDVELSYFFANCSNFNIKNRINVFQSVFEVPLIVKVLMFRIDDWLCF